MLQSVERYTESGVEAHIERSSIAGKSWLRYKQGDGWRYVFEDDVKVIAP